MMRASRCLACLGLMALSAGSLADASMANTVLQRAINELEVAKLYVREAAKLAPGHRRVVFHYGEVVADIDRVEAGIRQKFNRPRIQPRDIVPVRGDYLTVVGREGLK